MVEYAQMIIEQYENNNDNVEIIDVRDKCEELNLYTSALKYVERYG
jgi:hypothetical protein